MATASDFYSRGEYFEAQRTYQKIYKSLNNKNDRKQKAFIAKRLGQCYLHLNQYNKAENYFLNAVRNGIQDSLIYLMLSDVYLKQGKLEESASYLQKLLTSGDTISGEKIHNSIQYISSTVPTRYIVNTFPVLNNSRSSYSPMFNITKDVIYFSSTNEYSKGDLRSGITGMKNSDIWVSEKNENNEWGKPSPLMDADINTPEDEGIISFSPQGNRMYFTVSKKNNNNDTKVEIWYSNRISGTWDEPVRFELPDNDKFNYGHPAVSPDGKYLYFTSDRSGGYGNYDIWRVPIDGQSFFIENLGPEINSEGNDMFPYLRNDTLLYFSSDGHPGFGGLDIFCASFVQDNLKWHPANMGSPINSPSDDFGITFGEGEYGFFSSNRNDTRGYDHIYSFLFPENNCTLEGFVIDTEGYAIDNAIIRLVGDDGSIARDKSRKDGSFSIPLYPNTKYMVQASATGFLNASANFKTEEDDNDAVFNVDFTLVPLNKPVVIDNIYFDYNKASLRPESQNSLDSLISLMNKYPNIIIQINSHTDRIGSDGYNNELSQQRAISVVEYLEKNGGIDKKRLSSKGYGKSEPKIITPRLHSLYPQFEENIVLSPDYIENLDDENDREIADQINRRTEFEIISIDYNFY